MNQSPLHYLPIVTTVLSAIFGIVLTRAAMVRKSGPHLWWWAFGVFCYGAGTLIESLIALQGNTVEFTKLWYITGALLGGWPLAQGAVFLHVKRPLAIWLSYITISFVVAASVLVILSPVNFAQLQTTRPSGAILGWKWIRLMTPVINLYSFAFLVGGAIKSAIGFKKDPDQRHRWLGNIYIAVGAILPGIGGSFAVAGLVEVLYVMELIGLCLIWWGYNLIASHRVAATDAVAA